MVSTPLKNISQIDSPNRGENKKYLKPPPSHESLGKFTSHSLGRKMVSQLAPHDRETYVALTAWPSDSQVQSTGPFLPKHGGERQEKPFNHTKG